MSYDLATAEQAAYSPFFGYMGAASAQIFTVLGAAYGTAKSAVGISSMGVMRPELIMKSVIPVIMAGIIGIYGLVVSSLSLNCLRNSIRKRRDQQISQNLTTGA